jgi:hypothetical protein
VALNKTALIEEIAGKAKHVGTRWAVGYGLFCMRNSLDHLLAHRHELEALAGQAAEKPAEAAE